MLGLTLAIFGSATALPAAAAPPAPLRLVRIAVDTTSTREAQHATIVEPDAAAVGSRVVATYQVGRFFGGSAGAIGVAASADGGRTWRAGLLPGIPPAPGDRASDPVVAYDALHGRWLVATLVNTASGSSLLVNASADGLTWDAPVAAVSYPRNPNVGTTLDKEWLTCDNGAASPFRGRCYLAYTDLAHDIDPRRPGSNIGIQSSADGGVTWSAPVLLPVDADQVSPAVQPLVRRNGELVIVFFEDDVVRAVRSTDGGLTFAPRERVSGLRARQRFGERELRAFSLPTAAVAGDGTIYAAWPDCRFRSRCAANDIVWSRSTAPGRWTPPRRLPLARSADYVLPDLAADPLSANGLAVTFYARRGTALDVHTMTSKTGGARWSRPRRLNPVRMRLAWLAETASGRMVGDYTGTVFSSSRVVAVHVQARAPRGGRLNQAAYAALLPRP